MSKKPAKRARAKPKASARAKPKAAKMTDEDFNFVFEHATGAEILKLFKKSAKQAGLTEKLNSLLPPDDDNRKGTKKKTARPSRAKKPTTKKRS